MQINSHISKYFLSQMRDGQGPRMRSEVTVVEILHWDTCWTRLEHHVRGHIFLILTGLGKEERVAVGDASFLGVIVLR